MPGQQKGRGRGGQWSSGTSLWSFTPGVLGTNPVSGHVTAFSPPDKDQVRGDKSLPSLRTFTQRSFCQTKLFPEDPNFPGQNVNSAELRNPGIHGRPVTEQIIIRLMMVTKERPISLELCNSKCHQKTKGVGASG